MKKILTLIPYALFHLTLCFTAQAQTTNYQVHSLFVMNIAKYSTWPSGTGEFHIVVYGKSKIYDELAKQVAGKSINGLTVKVSQAETLADISDAQIVFLADGKSSNLGDIIKATEGKSIMIIAEREGLFKKGAGFSFVLTDNNTLRYDINNGELEKRNIKVSKNLAGLANTVI
jgi:hypothetical protein